MKKNRLHILVYIVLVLTSTLPQSLSGKSLMYEIEEKIFFRTNRSIIDSGYKTNNVGLTDIDSIINNRSQYGELKEIKLIASSSPEGRKEYNTILARKRSEAMYKYLCWKHHELREIPFHTEIETDWWETFIKRTQGDEIIEKHQALSKQIESVHSEAKRNEIIRRLTPRELRLWVERQHLQPLRYVRVIFTFKRGGHLVDNPISRDTTAEKNVHSQINQTTPLSLPIDTILSEEIHITNPIIAEQNIKRIAPWALKTNLLYDAISVVNIEAEWRMSRHLSLAGEWIFPWWLSEKRQNCLQLMSGMVSMKYWFTPSEKYTQTFQGWNAGIFTGGGLYDLEWNKKGYQGEFFISTGANVGYAHSISKNLFIEYALQIGFFRTNYRRYEAEQDKEGAWHLMRQESGRYSWVGPTALKISLGWSPTLFSKKGGRR